MKVLFTETRTVQDEKRGTSEATIYRAGQVYDLSVESANRWVNRKVATFDADMIQAAEDEDHNNKRETSSGDSVRGSVRPDSKTAPDSSSDAELIAKNPELSDAAKKASDNSVEENLKTQSAGRLTQVATSQNTPATTPASSVSGGRR
jgi:hypothetical protein